MRINTNIISQKTQEFMRLNQAALDKSMNRLSSGKRINSAADDAAGLAITTRMKVKSSGLEIASRNSQDGISLIETADSAMDSITQILTRMRDIALASTSGTISPEDKSLYDAEFQELVSAVDQIAQSTNFNGINLLNVTGGTVISIQVSDNVGANSIIEIKLQNVTTGGLTLTDIDVNDFDAAQAAVSYLDAAISTVGSARTQIGSSLTRLEFNVANVNSQKINTDQAASRIADADMAVEMSEMTKAKILTETAISMLSQANQTPQMISRLLQ